MFFIKEGKNKVRGIYHKKMAVAEVGSGSGAGVVVGVVVVVGWG